MSRSDAQEVCDRVTAYLAEPDDAMANDLLGSILESEVAPVVSAVVRRQLGGIGVAALGAEDLQDAQSEILLRVSKKLILGRSQGLLEPIESLSDYVAKTAYNACSRIRQLRAPEHTRLRYRLRYCLSRDCRLRIWEKSPRAWMCGPSAHTKPSDPVDDVLMIEDAARESVTRVGAENRSMPDVLAWFFRELGAPCSFEHLVGAMARAYGVRESAVVDIGDSRVDSSVVAEPADTQPSAQDALEVREFFRRLWDEVGKLPRPQRVALLFNLKDGKGRDVLGLIIAAGIVSLADTADIVALSEEDLSQVLQSLPMDDHRIAALLAVTRRQVINLRKSARARLGRRLGRELLPWW